MYISVDSNILRDNLSRYVNHMIEAGDRILITRQGTPIALLTSPDDLQVLEKISNSRESFMKSRRDTMIRDVRTIKDVLNGDGQ